MREKEAQVIIALAFGQGRNKTPGKSNEALARVVADLDKKYDLPIVAQWEIADCIPESVKGEKDLIVGGRRQDKRYFDTLEVMGQAKDHCAKFGLSRAIIVAHPDHLAQVVPVAEKSGFEVVVADTKKVPYDPVIRSRSRSGPEATKDSWCGIILSGISFPNGRYLSKIRSAAI